MEIISDLTRFQFQGIILIVAGLLLRYIIGRRRFNRRGLGNIQFFNSYLEALIVSAIEWLLDLIGKLALLSGLLLLLI
jgi:hypothetical protein